jgi:hypothetical protein
VRWGRHGTLSVNSPMPAHLGQHHWDPAVGDRLTAWEHVKAGEALDGNLYPMAGDLWWCHYDVPGKAGYPLVVDARTGHVRKMTRRERRTPGDRWGRAGIMRWRDHHGQRPMTHLEGLRWLVAHGIVSSQEVKGPRWAKAQWCFNHLYANDAATGHPAWVKRIVTLRFPYATVMRAHRAHVKIAAIYGTGVRGRARRLAHTRRVQRGWHGLHFDATW